MKKVNFVKLSGQKKSVTEKLGDAFDDIVIFFKSEYKVNGMAVGESMFAGANGTNDIYFFRLAEFNIFRSEVQTTAGTFPFLRHR